MLTLGTVVRLVPFLFPIQAQDVVQEDRALIFTDRHGLPLGTLLSRSQNQTMTVPLEQVAPVFLQAIVATEDQRFYHHHGVDTQAVVRAGWQALEARQVVSGASTITMQLARMLLGSVDRSLGTKLREVWWAWRLEAGMTKTEILTAYVNRLPMGGNLYGVEAAAQTYFQVSAADLTLAQATLLAALPNDPIDLHPYGNLPGLRQRQDLVLERMVQVGWAKPEQVARITTTEMTLPQSPYERLIAPHFLFWLAEQLPPDSPAQVTTSLDRPLQQFVTSQIRHLVQGLTPHNVNHAAALVIDNRTGDVLAYVGSPNYFGRRQGGNDGVQALRQPGSTLKPFLYQLALEQGILDPNSILEDIPTHYAIPGAQLYSPMDYSERFQGSVRLRLALANSLNLPAVRLLEQMTVPTFLARLQQLGFGHLTESAHHYGLGLALGSGEVSLWELARAYVTLARQGEAIPLKSWEGSEATHLAPVWQESNTWRLITDILADPYARAHAFGVDSVLALPFPAAVKTGTSSDFRDTWTVGYTSDYTVATWVGNFDGSAMAKVSGVTGAAPLWHRIMVKLHTQAEPDVFPSPSWPKVPLCSQTGLPPELSQLQAPEVNCEVVVWDYVRSQDLGSGDRHLPQGIIPNSPEPPPVPQPSPNSSPSNLTQLPAPTQPNLNQFPPIEVNSKTELTILFPQANDRFLLQPIPETGPNSQKLTFEITGPNNTGPNNTGPNNTEIIWRLNGETVATGQELSHLWDLQPGEWILEVEAGNQLAQVEFEVLAPEGRSLRRGFTIYDPLSTPKNGDSPN